MNRPLTDREIETLENARAALDHARVSDLFFGSDFVAIEDAITAIGNRLNAESA